MDDFTDVQLVDVVGAKPLAGLRLALRFSDGTRRTVDVRPLLRGPAFEQVRLPEVFRQVQVDRELGTVTWPNGADLDPIVLRYSTALADSTQKTGLAKSRVNTTSVMAYGTSAGLAPGRKSKGKTSSKTVKAERRSASVADETPARRRVQIRVVQRPNGRWAVQRAGKRASRVFSTRAAAENQAVRQAQRHPRAEVVIVDATGKVRRRPGSK